MKCIVGMSGGVDSSVSAALLMKKYEHIIGCTFKMFNSPQVEKSVADARKVADYLHIEHVVIDCIADFQKYVIDNFIDTYKKGCTPNPCIMCNRFVKFHWLNKVRCQYDADMMATGHYANVLSGQDGVELHQAKDLSKDQSYFLYKLHQDVLKYVEFPLGNFTKAKTRELAKDFNIPVAEKPESQDICFIPSQDYISFIKEHNGDVCSGEIISENGVILGHHNGTINYTIGQRKGLGLSGGPFFVKEIRSDKNQIIVSEKEKIKTLFINLQDVNFINQEYLGACEVKIRSANKKIKAEIVKNCDKITVKLQDAEYGIAKGQHCVFYINSRVIGGGIIC